MAILPSFYCLVAISRGIVMLTHENTISVVVSGFSVSRLATPIIILNSALDRVCVWIYVIWLLWLARSDEKW